MKNPRPIIYLLIALAVAFVIVLIERPQAPRVDDASEKYLSEEFDVAKATRVDISQLLDGAVLMRSGKRWYVANQISPMKMALLEKEGREIPKSRWYLADSLRVSGALGGFGGLRQGMLVSDNPAKRSLYQLDAAGLSVRVIGENDKPFVDVVIGKNGPDFDSSYLRNANDNKVYLVRRSLTGLFSTRVQDWREKKIWVLDPAKITALDVNSAKGSFRLMKGEGGKWREITPTEGNLDDKKMQELLKKLADVRASSFPEEGTEDALTKGGSELVLSMEFEGGSPLKLSVYKADDKGRYPAKLEGVDELYLISKDLIESIPSEPPRS